MKRNTLDASTLSMGKGLRMNQCDIDFWDKHSMRFLEMAFRSDKHESLSNPDGYGRRERECGDAITIYLIVRDGRILSASFETVGCLYSYACANAVVHLVEGQSIDAVSVMTPEDVIDYLETLPPSENHCAVLAIQALQLALANVRETLRHPWKKFYR